MNDIDNICDNCKWWTLREGADIGNCQRHAPIATGQIEPGDFEHQAIWPWTHGFDFCGDWEAGTTTASGSLDEKIPWQLHSARLRTTLHRLRDAWCPLTNKRRDFGYPTTYREVLAVGRKVFLGIRNCGHSTILPLDIEFQKRGCDQWIMS